MKCLDPKLTAVPDGDWLCPRHHAAQRRSVCQAKHLNMSHLQHCQATTTSSSGVPAPGSAATAAASSNSSLAIRTSADVSQQCDPTANADKQQMPKAQTNKKETPQS